MEFNLIDKYLLESRIIFLYGEIDSDNANKIIARLLYLDSVSHDEISLYINSPGGSVIDGYAIIDTMNLIKSDVATYVVGSAYSMAAVILSSGAKEKRFSLVNSEIMIHQPSGGVSGKADDVKLSADRLSMIKEKLIDTLVRNTKKSKKEIMKYFMKDYFMNSLEAKKIGLIDKIIKST